MAKCGTTLVRCTHHGRSTSWQSVVLLQAVWPLVRWTPPGWDISCPSVVLHQAGLPLVRWTPLAKTFHGQVWYYFKQADLWSNLLSPPHPLIEASHVKVWYYFGQADLWSNVHPPHLMAKCVTTLGRLTLCQMDPPTIPDEALGWVDISSEFILARLLGVFSYSISYLWW